MAQVISYVASPTAVKFHESTAFIRGWVGPIGCGKSSAMCTELMALMNTQYPNCEGIRKSRGAIIRNTYKQLSLTSLKTFQQWFPPSICEIVFHPTIVARLRYPLSDGTRIESEILFLALDSERQVDDLLSLEVSWAWINEGREIPMPILDALRGRVGRYPNEKAGYYDIIENGKRVYEVPKERNPDGSLKLDEQGNILYQRCTRPCIIMDTNPCDTEHWWYQLSEEGCLRKEYKSSQDKRNEIKLVKEAFAFFKSPAPLLKTAQGYVPNPDAENIRYLPGGYQYYLNMIAGNTDDFINVMVLGNYGLLKEGKPVYPQYNDRVHCAPDNLEIFTDLPVGIGWDFGLTPACVFGQLTDMGQLRIVAELVSYNMSVREFARDVVKPFIAKYFYDCEIAFSYGDPSGNSRGEGEGTSSIGILNDQYLRVHGADPLNLGFKTEPAPTNDPTRRIDAVISFLTKLVAKGEPGYLLSPRCSTLRKAKMGGYCYKKYTQQTTAMYKDKPDKNHYSHVSDAEQYLALGFLEQRLKPKASAIAFKRPSSNPLGY